MESTATISEFVESTKIKRTLIGGFDRESTYNFLQQLTAMYQQHIKNALSKREQTDAFCADRAMLSREQVEIIREDLRNECECEIESLRDCVAKLKDDYNDVIVEKAMLEEKLQTCNSELMVLQAERKSETEALAAIRAELEKVLEEKAELEKRLEAKATSEAVPTKSYEPARMSRIDLDIYAPNAVAGTVVQAEKTAKKIVSEANAEAEYIKKRAGVSVQEMNQRLDEMEEVRHRLSDTLIKVNDCLRSASEEIIQAEKAFAGSFGTCEEEQVKTETVFDEEAEYAISADEDASKAMIEYLAKRMIQYVKG